MPGAPDPPHNLFIDFKAAYDTIVRTEVWNTMQHYGFPRMLICLLRATKDGMQCEAKVTNMLSESFAPRRSLRDGHSWLLFNIAQASRMTLTSAAACEAYTRLQHEAEKIGLRISATKTKYQLAGGSDRDRGRLFSRVSVDDDDLDIVEEFCYLLTIVTSNNNLSSEIRKPIVQGNDAYY